MVEVATVASEDEQFKLIRELEKSGAFTSTALILRDPQLSYSAYEALGAFLGAVNRRCAWYIGDWIVFGEAIFGDSTYQAAEATGLAPSTLANRASVARHIPPERRRASLPFGVHAEVAYLEPSDRDHWLDRAEEGQWTRAKLRLEMRTVKEVGSGHRVGDLAVSGTAVSGDFLGEPELGAPTTTCPNCGHKF